MVNEKTPAPAQQPSRLGDLERERKRLRLDVKPRKVLTGDLMSMPMLGEPGPSQMPSESQPQAQPMTKQQQPLVDYVKESTDFMSALQDAVRVQSAGSDISPEWATEEDESSGANGEQRDQASFHQGKADRSAASASSPARQRRTTMPSPRHRTSERRSSVRQDVVPSALEQGSPQRVTSRRLPPDSSFITESSSNDIPMSSTLKSRASLSRRIAEQVKAGESPRKLLRRISAAAIAEEEVMQEFDGQQEDEGKAWELVRPADDAVAYRDEQIRQLEERIAKRRQMYTPAKPSNHTNNVPAENQEPRTVQRPQLITLHEPTLDAIAGQRQQDASDISDDESIMDDYDLQGQQDGNTRRFQDGIVLYDSERIPNPPPQDPARTLRNIASAVELRNRESDRASLARAASLLALPTQPHAPAAAADSVDPPTRRGDRTASSNTLVDPSNARTVSGDVGSQLTLSDLGGKGATITRTGSLYNISQIPEQEIESLGGGRLKFNKEFHRWEKVSRSRSSQEDLRSAASSRNEIVDGGVHQQLPISRTPIPDIPEASAELSMSQDVFSESPQEQQARAQLGGRTNSFQQRLGSLSSGRLSAADGQISDSSDPFRDFESFGQSSHAPASVSATADNEDESTPKPVKSQMFVSNRESRQQYGDHQAVSSSVQRPLGTAPAQSIAPQREVVAPKASTPIAQSLQPKSISPNGLVPRTLAASTVPRSSSSLRNVVTYSPDSTVSSRHSSLGQHPADARDGLAVQESESPIRDTLRDETQVAGNKRARENAHIYATPDRRLAHQHLGTPTPRASTSSISTPKSILKQPAGQARLNGGSHNTSANSAVGGGGTPNRTISLQTHRRLRVCVIWVGSIVARQRCRKPCSSHLGCGGRRHGCRNGRWPHTSYIYGPQGVG